MMDVPVHDQDSAQAVAPAAEFGCKSNIVEQAEPHGMVPFSMVARRPDQGKGIINPALP